MSKGAFALAAVAMAGQGLAVVPLGGEDGKRPLIRNWNRWRRRPGCEFIERLAAKYPSANVGIACGTSSLTVLDIDNPKIAHDLIHICGDTPLKVRTPSGGVHLYYRNNDERCSNLRPHGIEADLKARGGIVSAPPSARPDTGIVYAFLEGSWSDLSRLPTIRLPNFRSADNPAGDCRRDCADDSFRTGSRNNELFRSLLRCVHGCSTWNEALTQAQAINATFSPPLPDAEVVRTAGSAWKIHAEGRNLVGCETHVIMPQSQWSELSDNPDALALYGFLKAKHQGLRSRFAVSPKAMSAANILPGWGRRRIEGARDLLVERDYLNRIHAGGRCKGDAAQYSFGAKGARSNPNTN